MEQPLAGFVDRFGSVARQYAERRPAYPDALVDWLAEQAGTTDAAWDAGCGSGQLSVGLARRFGHVWATDPSAGQLGSATAHARVEYRLAPAERCGLADGCCDLVVAAQAAHWFDLPAFYREARRVGRPGSLVALVTYDLCSVTPQVDALVSAFYHEALAGHWPPERRLVETHYRSLDFPFAEIAAPPLAMSQQYTLAEFLAYVGTWSAVGALIAAGGRARLEAFAQALARVWGGPPQLARAACWPLFLRAGR